jgi:predicted dinucleotide-binding enzyme
MAASPARHHPGLPDGDVELVLADGDDETTETELARLNDALGLGFEAINAGDFRPAREAIADLRHRLR